MKLKCTITGQIWDVDYVVALQGNRVAKFYNDYELIPDEPQSSYDPHARIDTLREAIKSILKRVESIESERKGVADVIQLHGNELNEITERYAEIVDRVHSLESDNQRLKDRLNEIESGYTQGEP